MPGVPAFTDFARFLAERPDVPVVSLCMPPVPRYAYAEAALKAGRHVMLEKPPGATVAEVQALAALAAAQGVTLLRHLAQPHGPRGGARHGLAGGQDRHPRPHHLARGCAANGTRGRTGCSNPAAWASSTPASTPSRS